MLQIKRQCIKKFAKIVKDCIPLKQYWSCILKKIHSLNYTLLGAHKRLHFDARFILGNELPLH